MSHVIDSALVLKDLVVGGGTAQIPSKQEGIGAGNELLHGSIDVSGVVHIGAESFYKGQSTLMVATSPKQQGDRALHVKGNVKIEGDDGTSNALNISGNQENDGAITASDDITTSTHFIGDITKTSGTPPGCKAFDISHPTKDGYRLRHICLEGPESAVYFRGKLRNRTTIPLPIYWKGLVDPTTITVILTPIGAHQYVIVKRVEDTQIHLQAQGGMPINCYFHVFGTRQDVERLVVEYEGTSTDDYPGDNSVYSINK